MLPLMSEGGLVMEILYNPVFPTGHTVHAELVLTDATVQGGGGGGSGGNCLLPHIARSTFPYLKQRLFMKYKTWT